jgi:predicted permease
MGVLVHEIRHAARVLSRDRAYALMCALTLIVCMGANTALFSVVNGVLLNPLPLPESDRILSMFNSYPKAGAGNLRASAAPDYFDRLRETDVFEEQAAYTSGNLSIDQNGIPTRIRVENVTPSFFRLLRVQPWLGRTFIDEEGEVGNTRKAVLSFALWQSAFGGDPTVVGRDVRLDGIPYSVVGVMPQDFLFADPETLLWRPLAFTAQQKSDQNRHSANFSQIGRLKPGASLEQARAQIDALNARNLDRFPQFREIVVNAGFHTVVVPLQDTLVGELKATLYLMWGGALFVLLIGCVNVANLVLARSRTRMKELATRVALGASRGRIAAQLMIESTMLTVISGVIGLAFGWAALRALNLIGLQELPRGSEVRLDAVAVVYTLAIAIALGLILGLIPTLAVIPARLTTVLREEGRSGTSGRGARTLRRVLVAAQVGFAFMLLIGAGLLFASFKQVLEVDPGFDGEGVLTASITVPRSRYPTATSVQNLADAALGGIRALPGVKAAGTTDAIPFGGRINNRAILAEGYQMRPGESIIAPSIVMVSPGYFEAMGTRLVNGRFLDGTDAPSSLWAAVVDRRLAQRFWPEQDPLGRRMYFPTDLQNMLRITEQTVFFTVVGVIEEMKLQSLTQGDELVGTMYFPLAQNVQNSEAGTMFMTLAVKSEDDAPLAGAVRGVIAGLDPQLPVFDVQTMQARTDASLVSRRSPMLLSVTFGVVALFLSAIGIYGVLAYLVTQRTREIGIRLALGSSARSIFELILREGIVLTVAGLALGTLGALALSRSLEAQLFQVRTTDPWVLAPVTLLLIAIAAVACAVPARRATRINPIVALTD